MALPAMPTAWCPQGRKSRGSAWSQQKQPHADPRPRAPALASLQARLPGRPPPSHAPSSPSPPGSCLNTLKQSKSNYHEPAAGSTCSAVPGILMHTPSWLAASASPAARCSRAAVPPSPPAAWHSEGRPAQLPAQLSLTTISRKIITPRSHTYGTSYLRNIYCNTCPGFRGRRAGPRPHAGSWSVASVRGSLRASFRHWRGWGDRGRAQGLSGTLGWGLTGTP